MELTTTVEVRATWELGEGPVVRSSRLAATQLHVVVARFGADRRVYVREARGRAIRKDGTPTEQYHNLHALQLTDLPADIQAAIRGASGVSS